MIYSQIIEFLIKKKFSHFAILFIIVGFYLLCCLVILNYLHSQFNSKVVDGINVSILCVLVYFKYKQTQKYLLQKKA